MLLIAIEIILNYKKSEFIFLAIMYRLMSTNGVVSDGKLEL